MEGFLRAMGRVLTSPFRLVIQGLGVLVRLTPRQMQSLCTLAMILGIIANSFWICIYVTGVREEVRRGMPFNSPYFQVAIDVVEYLAIMSGCFALFMCLIAFGADWLRLKYKDVELGVKAHSDDD